MTPLTAPLAPVTARRPRAAAARARRCAVALVDGELHELSLPSPRTTVIPGVRWGQFDWTGTAAYWRVLVWFDALERAAARRRSPADAPDEPDAGRYALGRSLLEETAACLLGGYGIPAAVGLAAFSRVRDAGILAGASVPGMDDPVRLAARLRDALRTPLVVSGRPVHYRFAAQKAAYVAAAVHRLVHAPPPVALQTGQTAEDHRALRDWLLSLPGVGLKTASWIVRNHHASDAVAVLDVHLIRAGRNLRVFRADHDVAKHYRAMEARYLAFAAGLGVSAAALDDVMWRALRRRTHWELPATPPRREVSTPTRRTAGASSSIDATSQATTRA